MAASGTVTIQGSVTGLPTGSKIFQASVTSAAAVDHTLTQDLSAGANTITIPSGATCVMITPPSGNTQALTLKGVSGDTGIAISKTKPTLLSFDTPPANFVINAAGSVTGCVFAFM